MKQLHGTTACMHREPPNFYMHVAPTCICCVERIFYECGPHVAGVPHVLCSTAHVRHHQGLLNVLSNDDISRRIKHLGQGLQAQMISPSVCTLRDPPGTAWRLLHWPVNSHWDQTAKTGWMSGWLTRCILDSMPFGECRYRCFRPRTLQAVDLGEAADNSIWYTSSYST